MNIQRFDPTTDEHSLRACHEMAAAGQPIDDPRVPPMNFRVFRGWWTFGFAGNPMQTWIATDDAGHSVGGYLLELPERENRANAFGFIIVAPFARRRGIGTALLGHMASLSAQASRCHLISATREGAPGTAFAAATGGEAASRGGRRILEFHPGLSARLAALRAEAERHAADYSLRSWAGPYPEDLIQGVCAVFDAMGDAPHPDTVEPELWDPARLRQAEDRVGAQGTHWYSVAALAADGEVAAITQVNVDPARPEWAWQELTAVTRPHRGHRLGLLIKVAMLQLLADREPRLERIVTDNDEPNSHMIAINEELGFRVVDYFQEWDHDVARTATLT